MLCVHLILLLSIVPPSVSTGCFQCSIKSAAWKAPRRRAILLPISKRSGENAYNISLAVAGFAGADLSIEVKENTLTVRGNKQSSGEEESDLIYQGIAERNFERNFQLADHVQIKGASLENGLLQVDLLRVVPEAMKPRAIPITTAKKVVLEAKAAKIAA